MRDSVTLEPSPTPSEFYHIVRGQIEHEDNLITQRLSWFLASQAFLFTAFAIAMNGPTNPQFGRREQVIFFKLIPVVAISVGVLIWMAICAGTVAMGRLRASLESRSDVAGFPPIQGRTYTRWMGQAAPILLPPLFVAVWCVLLIVG